MRWERRKPLWPRVAALGLLLVLVLAAPHSWQSLRSGQSPPVFEPKRDRLAEIALSEPVILQPPVAQRVERLPIRREFDWNTLLSVRDKLQALFDQLPSPQPVPIIQPVLEVRLANEFSRSAPQVRVASENDRLAMVPRRVPRSRQPRTPNIASASIPAVELGVAMRPTMANPNEKTAQAKPQSLEPLEQKAAALQLVIPTPLGPAPLRHRPLALIKQLEGFSVRSPGAVWSQLVLARVRQLTEEPLTEKPLPEKPFFQKPPSEKDVAKRPQVAEILDQLEQLYVSGIRQAEDSRNPTLDVPWRQAAQSLGRRLVLWRLLLDPKQQKIVGHASVTFDLLPVLQGVAEVLDTANNGNDWRDYLLLDRLATATSEGIRSPILVRAKLAQKVLSRMTDPQLTDAQLDFLTTPPLVKLHESLQPWAAGKVNLETLAVLIERYESGRETRYAAMIAQLQQRLKWSDHPRLPTLAAQLDRYYRGANMRLAMSNDLFNRMLPKQEPIISPVHARIAGAKVRGRARTTTQLRVRLLPDPNAWYVRLEATGKVYSDTRSETWPVRVRNAAKMQYRAHKDITLDEQGLRASPAQASAQGRNELLGVDSQLDPIPIVGHLLRNMARQKHKKSRSVAITQAKAKVVQQAKQRLDNTLDKKLEMVEQKFRDKVLAPIEALALFAEPLEMHTTERRAVMQLRFADPNQLAAHTLRPIAPSDSVLSLQMHETALNNAMAGLGLDGRRMTLHELFRFITQRLGQANATPPEDMPRGAVIEFARRDALRVQCDGDRLELVMSIAELAHQRDKIKNFQIHVHYHPRLSGLSVKLVREGSLQFSGRRLKTGPRVVLHSVMGKLFVKDQEINLVSAQRMLDPRFSGLMVTQLVIEDGWIGLALGPTTPRRTAWRAPTPEVLVTPFVR